MQRIVASYTTLPGREDTLEKSIKSLLEQTRRPDVIYLTLPAKAERLNKEYPEPSDFIKQHCRIVRIPKDFGPATKLYGALQEEKDKNILIFSCDDDTIYPPTILEKLLSKTKKYPHAVITGTGALLSRGLVFISISPSVAPFHKFRWLVGPRIDKNGRKVDLVYGSAGVLYRRGMFEYGEALKTNLWDKVFISEDRSVFHNDDVLFSAYLCKRGIERRAFPDVPSVTHLNGNDALSAEFFTMYFRMWRAIDKMREIGYFTKYEDNAYDESFAFRTIIFILIIILLIVLLVIWLKMK